MCEIVGTGVILEAYQQPNQQGADMETQNAIKKLAKAGFEVKQTGNRYFAQAGRNIISFFEQSGSVICINVRSSNDQDDAQSDYSAGVFCDNLTQAIRLAR
jgi:hypothetical protein